MFQNWIAIVNVEEEFSSLTAQYPDVPVLMTSVRNSGSLGLHVPEWFSPTFLTPAAARLLPGCCPAVRTCGS